MKRSRRTPSQIRLLASREHPFWSVVHMAADDDACWPWGGAVNRDGYGSQRPDRAHRIAWELANRQDLLDGQVVIHACDSPACCNPRHLIVAPIARAHDLHRGGQVKRSRRCFGLACHDYCVPDRFRRPA